MTVSENRKNNSPAHPLRILPRRDGGKGDLSVRVDGAAGLQALSQIPRTILRPSRSYVGWLAACWEIWGWAVSRASPAFTRSLLPSGSPNQVSRSLRVPPARAIIGRCRRTASDTSRGVTPQRPSPHVPGASTRAVDSRGSWSPHSDASHWCSLTPPEDRPPITLSGWPHVR